MRLDIPWIEALRSKRVILASGSPRRKEILSNLGLNFEIVPSLFPETLDKSVYKPKLYVSETARQKALEVYERLANDKENPPNLVVGADTIVVLGDDILEKPHTPERAHSMLRQLSGRSHSVFTAVALVAPGPRTHVFVEETEVLFSELSDETIEAYVKTGEPLDKAGAYGYQGLASFFVSSIRGDYWNVVGFPTCRFFAELQIFLEKSGPKE
ncbi:uncharacterized protein VTP21DRAFT_9585 [Calcarisporiella thermophila]|uniref:uncharacterized protein n=1 Tax=Calcarisporiella thermophila TaxID=911321 RepID=UPI0037440EAB